MSYPDPIFHRLVDETLSDIGRHEPVGPQQPATTMLPVAYPDPGVISPPAVSGFATSDGSVYARIHPDDMERGAR